MLGWLKKIIDRILENKQWIFSGVGVAIASGLLGLVFLFYQKSANKGEEEPNSQVVKDENGNTDIHKPVPTLYVSPITDQSKTDELSWLSTKVEKDLIKLFSNAKVPVFAEFTIDQQDSRSGHGYIIGGRIYQKDTSKVLYVYLSDKVGEIISTAELQGDITFFTEMQNVIAQSLVYKMDIDTNTLKKKNTRRRPTLSVRAFTLYLLAIRRLNTGKKKEAITLLERSVKEDPQFAMACWKIAQIYGKDDKGKSDAWDKKAKLIDPDHPRWEDLSRGKKPLPELLRASGRKEFAVLDPGISYKTIEVQEYGLKVGIWVLDLNHYDISIMSQKEIKGDSIDVFAKRSNAVIALNGAFFEMDRQHRLSPSGLLLNRAIGAFPRIFAPYSEKGGSGVFVIRDSKPDIISSKNVQNPDIYDLAIQSGPRLVESGGKMGIYSNNYDRHNRSAVGICKNKVILAIVAGEKGEGLSLYEFAKFLRTPGPDGVGCDMALNLDGGPSSQLYFKYGEHREEIKGLWRIHNAIVVTTKNGGNRMHCPLTSWRKLGILM